MFIVLKPANTSQGSTNPLFGSTNGAGSTRAGIFCGLGGNGKWNIGGRRLDADSSQFIAGNAFTTAAKLITAVFDWANATLTLYEDGTQANTTASFQTAGNTSNTASAELCLGANTASGAGPFAGDIAEVAMYGTVSDADRNTFGGYIQTKYGITVAGATFGATIVPVAMHHYKTMRS